jgi:hypothetical protein
MLRWRRGRDLKIMLLQLRKRRPRLHISLEGSLGGKRQRRAQGLAEELRSKVADSIVRSGWKHVPRARMAVTMTFFPGGKQAPALHNLVKFYLDELRSLVFDDDRQVSYLAAESWQPISGVKTAADKESRVFIKVERLADYKNKFDLYFSLSRDDGFRDYLRYGRRSFRHDHRKLFDNDDDDDDDLEFDSWYLRDTLLLTPESRERIRRLNMEQDQRRLLAVNGIDSLDRPGLPRWAKHLPGGINELRSSEHLSVELGNLPLRGETAQYKQRIRESLQALKARQHDFYPLLLPVELDVQVFSHAPKLSKDLDNIMRDVAPVVKEELLHPDAYVHGYRIYVADTDVSEHKSDFLRLKLLPSNAVSDFEKRMRETFEVAKEWLEEEIYKHY